MRISGLDLNNVKAALAHRSAILENPIKSEDVTANAGKTCPFGEDVKMVRKITQKQKILTSAEKDEMVPKYESGMTMTAIADQYGCHYTTVGKILRKKGIKIRD